MSAPYRIARSSPPPIESTAGQARFARTVRDELRALAELLNQAPVTLSDVDQVLVRIEPAQRMLRLLAENMRRPRLVVPEDP